MSDLTNDVPPCPADVDPALWAEGVGALYHPRTESPAAYELRLRLFAQLFGPAFQRKQAAKETSP